MTPLFMRYAMLLALSAVGAAQGDRVVEIVGGIWIAPTYTELQAGWRDRSKDRFAVVRGDFDGDGKEDVAWLVMSMDGKKAALSVMLGGSHVKIIDLQVDGPTALSAMGIEVLSPGAHGTACGKSHRRCRQGEAEVLELAHDGIRYFANEGAASVFYLPKRGGEFRRVWLSD